MTLRTNLILATTLLLIIAATQESQGPTQAERVVVDNPEVITLELTPITRRRHAGVYEKISGPFRPGSKIVFDLMGTNTSILPLVVYGWDTFHQNRPLLFRDGQEVLYRKGLEPVLKSKDKEAAMEVIHLVTTRLDPDQTKVLEKIDLNTWYEPLELGHYQLSLRHRFLHMGKWVESTSITFEVEANAK